MKNEKDAKPAKPGTILEYIEEFGGEDFYQRPLGDVDSLILSQLAYARYEHCCGAEDPKWSMLLSELKSESEEGIKNLCTCPPGEKSVKKLLEAAEESKRFGAIRLERFVNEIDTQQEKQFSAVTFVLNKDAVYVAFRGTDSTLIGWKEDLNMSFMKEVPSQVMARDYLAETKKRYRQKIYVGGHSKGGNLAVFAACKVNKTVQKRLIAVFDHDGPGFAEQIVPKNGEGIGGLIRKTVPKSSIVGMLLSPSGKYRVVESKAVLLLQHNPFSWLVADGDFVYTEEISAASMHIDNSIKEWLSDMDAEDRKLFVNTLFDIVNSDKVINIEDFVRSWRKNAAAAFKATKNIDEKTRKYITDTISELLKLLIKKE